MSHATGYKIGRIAKRSVLLRCYVILSHYPARHSGRRKVANCTCCEQSAQVVCNME